MLEVEPVMRSPNNFPGLSVGQASLLSNIGTLREIFGFCWCPQPLFPLLVINSFRQSIWHALDKDEQERPTRFQTPAFYSYLTELSPQPQDIGVLPQLTDGETRLAEAKYHVQSQSSGKWLHAPIFTSRFSSTFSPTLLCF